METPKFVVGQRVCCQSTSKDGLVCGQGILAENIYLYQFKAFVCKVWFFDLESVRTVPEEQLAAAPTKEGLL